jgi:predicted dehydrogenase
MNASPEPLRVGVVGVGHIGKNHARIFSELPDARFAAVFDSSEENAREAVARYGVGAADSIEAFADQIDAATVATPTPFHHPVAKALIERGKHVLIEKPITDNTAQARDLVELANRHGVVLQVGHVERFNPVMKAIEGCLNRPRFIEAHRLSPYPSRSTDIGVVLDLMIHDIEIVLHLVRSPIESVDAVGVAVLSRQEDIANARIRFQNGCVANITASRISPERMRKIRVFQEDAYLSLDYRDQKGYMFRLAEPDAESRSLLKKLFGGADSTVVTEFAGRKIVREPVVIEEGEPLKLQLASFVACCRQGNAPAVSGPQATAALDLALDISRRIEGAAVPRPMPVGLVP